MIDDEFEADRSEEEGEGQLEAILRTRKLDAESRKRQNRDEKHDQEHVPHVKTVSGNNEEKDEGFYKRK